MRKIAVLNHKGGSGKTTTVVNAGAALAERGRRVLILDLDPSGGASFWLGASQDGADIIGALSGRSALADFVRETTVPGLDIIPASLALSRADKDFAGESGAELLLKNGLSALQGHWDYLLMDCPPTLGILSLNALGAAKELLVPVEAHVMTLAGLVSLMEAVAVVKEKLNAALSLCGIAACRVDTRIRHTREVVQSLRDKFGHSVFKTLIRENVRLAESPSFGKPVTLYAPSSPGAEDYRGLAGEIEERGP